MGPFCTWGQHACASQHHVQGPSARENRTHARYNTMSMAVLHLRTARIPITTPCPGPFCTWGQHACASQHHVQGRSAPEDRTHARHNTMCRAVLHLSTKPCQAPFCTWGPHAYGSQHQVQGPSARENRTHARYNTMSREATKRRLLPDPCSRGTKGCSRPLQSSVITMFVTTCMYSMNIK